jgi:hypothetical protein
MRIHLFLAAAVAILAVSVRVHHIDRLVPLKRPGTENERVADSLAHGRGWADTFGPGTGPSAHVAPVYPLMLAGIYRLFGNYETASGLIVQRGLCIVLATLGILLLPVVARKLGLSMVAGWMAAFVAACLPANLPVEVTGRNETVLSTLALLGVIWCLADLRQRAWSGTRAVVRTGVLLGLVALASPNLLLGVALYFLAELWLRAGDRLRIFRCAVGLAAICVLFVAPWMVRNYLVLGGIVPVRSNFGLELAVGNRPEANGHSFADGFEDMHPYLSATERERLTAMGELAYMRDKQQQALTWIAEHPLRFARLTLSRIRLFWFTDNEQWCRFDLAGVPVNIPIYGLMGLAVLVELFRLMRGGQGAAVLLAAACLGLALPYFFTHVEVRYRLPIVGLSALLTCNLVLTSVLWLRDRLFPATATAAPRAS